MKTLSYTSDGPHVNPKWMHKEIAHNAISAIGCLTRAIGAQNVVVRDKPSKGVFALGSIARGKLVLVPTSYNVKLEELSNSEKVKGIQMTGDASFGHFLVINSMIDNDLPVPLWYTQAVDDEDSASVVYVVKTAKLSVNYGDHVETHSFGVPCLTNTCALKKGDEIKLYREKKVTEKRALCKVGTSAGSSADGQAKVARK